MLATGLLLVAIMTSDAQAIETPALFRPGQSAPLARRFATLFPVDGAVTVPPRSAPANVLPQHRLVDPRLLHQDRQEIICGLTVVTKSADIDPGILIRRNHTFVPAVRRIEPDACRPDDDARK